MVIDLVDLKKIKKMIFLGPNYSYTDFAKEKFIRAFDLDCVTTNLKSITSIMNALKEEDSENLVAVIPIENSIEGIVRETLDNLFLLQEHEYQILAETTLNINHALIGYARNLSEIKVVRSHPQALAQCRNFIQTNLLKNVIEEAMLSTSSGIKSLNIHQKNICAIGSVEAAQKYNIPVIKENINDELNNKTRFIMLGKFISRISGNDKTSLTFSTKNEVGALNKILTILHAYNINMTYIDSRPSKKELGEYVFYIDIEGHAQEKKIALALNEIKNITNLFYIIGSYHSI